LVSNEVIRPRINILRENLTKWGNANVVITNSDPQVFSRLNAFFDLILVDAPCSGEGLFLKHKQAISEWSPTAVELCSQRQKRILADVWSALKPNGMLVYSTCTYNRTENEENLQWLSSNADFESIELSLKENWGIEKSESNGIIGYRLYPHKVKGEALFMAVLRKKGGKESKTKKSPKEAS